MVAFCQERARPHGIVVKLGQPARFQWHPSESRVSGCCPVIQSPPHDVSASVTGVPSTTRSTVGFTDITATRLPIEDHAMSETRTCPDCKGDMEIGFVPDHYAQIVQSRWHPGTATEKTVFGNLKLDPNSMIPITAFRCTQCGLLKHYAAK